MEKKLTQEEAAVLIKGRKILKSNGLSKGTDVKAICEAAGVSRKTGYQWADKFEQGSAEEVKRLAGELARLREKHAELERRYDDVRFENEGRKLAWKLHGVDELLAGKKKHQTRRAK